MDAYASRPLGGQLHGFPTFALIMKCGGRLLQTKQKISTAEQIKDWIAATSAALATETAGEQKPVCEEMSSSSHGDVQQQQPTVKPSKPIWHKSLHKDVVDETLNKPLPTHAINRVVYNMLSLSPVSNRLCIRWLRIRISALYCND